MPFPSASSFTQTKWLAFFAELTAKLTHHNVLVVMEGAELLKRLLISRVSIAAILQQGDLLVRLLDCWRGCVAAETLRAVDAAGAHQSSTSTSYPVNATAPISAAAALNDELSFVLAEAISQCVDLMWSLYADGDAYYCLLVLARAGPMLEVLVDVLQTAPPQLYGITASLLQQLLSLPLGHSEVDVVTCDDREKSNHVNKYGGGSNDLQNGDNTLKFIGLDKTTLAQLHKSVALRRHICSLVEAVQEHGALLQHTTDVLAGLLAVQQGPRCLAAVYLFNLASKRLRKYELRHGLTSKEASPSPSVARNTAYAGSELQDRTGDNSELNVTITGAPQAAASPPPASRARASSHRPANSALDDLEEGIESSSSVERAAPSPKASQTVETKESGDEVGPHTSPSKDRRSSSAGATEAEADDVPDAAHGIAPQDVSAVVDDEPVRYVCTVPPSLADEALRHLATAPSHAAFFDALDWLWCLTVADPAAVGAALGPDVFTSGLGRYLRAAPRTRRDRMLFTLLLLWLGHLHSISALRSDTHRCLLDVAATALLPMLQAELTKGTRGAGDGRAAADVGAAAPHGTSAAASLNVSAITPTDTGVSGVTSAMVLAASTGYSLPLTERSSFAAVPPSRFTHAPQTMPAATFYDTSLPNVGDATMLPYAAARKAQEAALLLRPSIEVILLAFLLNIHTGIDAASQRTWVVRGRVLDVALAAVRRAGNVRSALLDAPATLDGALSDEVYLDYALRSVRTDVTTVAVLGCRLMAAVLSSQLRWGAEWCDVSACEREKSTGVATAASSDDDAASMQAELRLFTQTAMPLLVHIAVQNPDVVSSQDSNAAASPVHHVPANLRCTRHTSLGESSLVALDACLQFYAQSGQLRCRGGPTGGGEVTDPSQVAIEDLVRVLPALTRVSHGSVHPPVRAVPYRCLLYISQRIEDVLVVLRDMPSLANAAVGCVLDYGAASSQWEVAAAAEWLTVLVDFMTEAEAAAAETTRTERQEQGAQERPPPAVDVTVMGAADHEEERTSEAAKQSRRRLLGLVSPAEQLREYFHFDDSPLARKLLTSVVAARRSNTGSAYAMSALLQLAVHLQTYVDNRRQRTRLGGVLRSPAGTSLPSVRGNAKMSAAEGEGEKVVQPLTPAGLSSIAQWILLLQSATADNTRLTRICSAFQRSREREKAWAEEDTGATTTEEPATTTSRATRRQTLSKPVLKDAGARALTAAEQIALQYNFTATLFRALDQMLRQDRASTASLYGRQFTNALICNAVVSAVKLPCPHDVAALLSMRFHAAHNTGKANLTSNSSTSSSSFCVSTSALTMSTFSSPALLFGYQAVIQWACCMGAKWLRGAYPCSSNTARTSDDVHAMSRTTSITSGGGLPAPCSAALIEDLCEATTAVIRNDTAALSQRTRCEAAALLSALVDQCPRDQLPLLEARGAALFAAAATLRRTAVVSGLQCRLLRRLRSAARSACGSHRCELSWFHDNVEALRATVDRIKAHGGDGLSDRSPRRGRSAQRQQSPQLVRSPKARDTAAVVRDLQAFQVLTSVLTSLVACAAAEPEVETAAAYPPAAKDSPSLLLLAPSQRQALCAVLCDALCVATLRHCVLTAVKGMCATAEGRRCLLTDISTAGDPLGRTLFGRVLALTLQIPCRWASGAGVGLQTSIAGSPTPSPRRQGLRRRSPSPGTVSHCSSHTQGQEMYVAGTEGDGFEVAVAGCDLCTALMGREAAEENVGFIERAYTSKPADDVAPTAVQPPASSFLAAFVKHRGLDYLSRAIVEGDQHQRRHGRPLTVPLHLLRLLAALSLRSSVAKDIVKRADLFSVVLELAGAAFAPHAVAATLALLTLRNVCFDIGLKSALCQDARVVLTLKAAVLELSCVSSLVEDRSTHVVAAPTRQKTTGSTMSRNGGNNDISPTSSPSNNRRARVEVSLRNDVVDPDNAATVAWATQMCVYARTRRVETASPAPSKAEGDDQPRSVKQVSNGTPVTSSRRAAFHDITNAAPPSVSDVSVLSTEIGRAGDVVDAALRVAETATDADARRRQYLAATALASLWYDNQRGKAAIAEVLACAPVCSIDKVQELAKTTPL